MTQIDHLGIAVKSLVEAKQFYERLGLTVMPEEVVEAEKVRVAMVPVGESRIELLEPTVPDSTIAKFLEKRGQGLHHVAFFVDDLEAAQAELADRGWPEAMRAETASGAVFVFHDATAELGHMIELYVGSPGLRGFYAMVAQAAQGWDGTDPVRTVGR